jgi:hypothetical protein
MRVTGTIRKGNTTDDTMARMSMFGAALLLVAGCAHEATAPAAPSRRRRSSAALLPTGRIGRFDHAAASRSIPFLICSPSGRSVDAGGQEDGVTSCVVRGRLDEGSASDTVCSGDERLRDGPLDVAVEHEIELLDDLLGEQGHLFLARHRHDRPQRSVVEREPEDLRYR